MNLHYISHDVVPILQFFVTAIGLFSLFLIWWQAKRTTRWNQVQSHHQFFKDTPSPEAQRQEHTTVKKIGIDPEKPLDAQSARKIDQDDDAHFAVQNVLNDFEELCSAVEAGTVGEDYAYAVDSFRLRKTYKIYKALIDFWREKDQDAELFVHIQKVALRWEARELAFHDKERRAIAKAQRKLAKLEERVQKKRDAARQSRGLQPLK
jgi:uncharacterized protein DUF4760